MDRKSIIVIVVSVVLILFWGKLVDTFVPPPPPRSTNTVATATNQLSTTNAVPATTVGNTDTNGTTKPLAVTKPGAPEELLSITNESGVYVFTSHGGGIKRIELSDYKETIECGKESTGELRPAMLNANTRTPAMALLGAEALQDDGIFQLTKTESGVRAEKQLANGLRIQKDFVLQTNFLLTVKVQLENTSDNALKLPRQEWIIGTATPMSTNDDGMTLGSYYYDGKVHDVPASWFDNKTLGCFSGTPRAEFISPPAVTNNVGWAATHNQFFTIAAIPSQPAALAISRRVELTNSKEIWSPHKPVITNGYETALIFPESILKEKGSIEHQFTIYAGPKQYQTLARIGAQYKNDFDKIMNFGMFSWFSEALLSFLNWLHSVGLSYGVAIIVMTVIVKLVFWPLTAASTRSMKRMQALAPKVKELQEKYKDNPQKFSQKQWELWREHKVNPLSGCMPMLVQIPVFIGLFQMLRSAIELRGASFLWACDLSQADTVAFIAGFPINPIAIIMIATSFWQAYIMPTPQDADPQQKMLKYMPIIFLVLFYKTSAGLTLYWTVQNLLTILQTSMTKNEEPGASTPPGKAKTPVTPTPQKKK